MFSLEVLLPEKLAEVLKERAKAEGKMVDELIVEILLERLNIQDPEVKVELHAKLCEKYLQEAEELLRKANYIQASEKAWGAASQILKAIAYARDNKRLVSHGELWEYANKVAKEIGKPELTRLWKVAISLHVNFYEGWAPAEDVKRSIDDVREFVRELKGLLPT